MPPNHPGTEEEQFDMGKIEFGPGSGFGSRENTLKEYSIEAQEALVDHHLSQMASSLRGGEGTVCYVLGAGGHPKSTYAELKGVPGIEVIWSKSIMPSPFKVLSIVVASCAGLVKVSEPESLPAVVKKLCHMLMAIVYVFDQSLEQDFVRCTMEYPDRTDLDFGTKHDAGYFLYMVDADNAESSTGIYEFISCGKEASDFARVF